MQFTQKELITATILYFQILKANGLTECEISGIIARESKKLKPEVKNQELKKIPTEK